MTVCKPNCGKCCDPVTFNITAWYRMIYEHGDGERARYAESVAAGQMEQGNADYQLRNVDFINKHWTPQRDQDLWSNLVLLQCDKFDHETRTCTAYEDRPPICSDYPFYGADPGIKGTRWLLEGCSFIEDVPVVWVEKPA